MDLKSLSIGRKAIVFEVTVNPNPDSEIVSTEDRKVTAHEAPLDGLVKAFAALAPVWCEIMDVPADYTTGLSITKLTVIRTKGGTRSVAIRAKKELEVRRDYLHVIDSPFVQIDKPADGESGEVQIESKFVKLVCKAVQEAEKYARGERSQALLNLEASTGINALADKGRELDLA
jgi:hypothetical protein